ncbi:hypothetical protein ACK3TF_002696 [Chlorella vulgaris]
MSVSDTATSQASQAAAASQSAGESTSGRFEVGSLWEGAKAWAADAWEEAQGAALARQQAYNAWLDHHWQSFEERVQQRLGDGEEWRAWKEQQRQRWGELAEEGEQLMALVGEMRDTGTRLAGGFRALGTALGGAGTRGK